MAFVAITVCWDAFAQKFGKTLSILHAFGFIHWYNRENKTQNIVKYCFSGLDLVM